MSGRQAPHPDLRTLLACLPDLVVEIDRNGCITYVNRLDDAEHEGILGSCCLDWVHPDFHATGRRLLEEVFALGQPREQRLLTGGRAQESLWMSVKAAPVSEEAGVTSVVLVARDIRDQKQAEEALEHSEARWRTLMRAIPDNVVLLDARGIIQFTNSLASDLPLEQVIGVQALDFIVEEDRVRYRAAMDEALRTGLSQECEVRVKLPEGVRWFSCNLGVVPMPEQEPALLVISRDTTDRRRAEEDISQSEARLREVIDLVPHLLFARDLEGRFHLANRATAEAYGTTVQELLGKHLHEVHPDADEARFYLEDDRQVYETGQPTYYAAKDFTDKHGRKRILETHKIPFTLPGSSDPVVLGMALDVTGRERMLRALQDSEEKYRSLVENINDIIFIQNLDGIITYISPVVERKGLYKTEEIIGRSFVDFVHPADLPALMASRQKTLAGELEPAEFRVLGQDGSVHYVRTSSSLLYEDGQVAGLSGVLTDLTEQRAKEHLLRDSEERFRWIYTMAPLVIIAMDRDGRIVDWNLHAEKLFGWTKHEVAGRRFCEFAVPESSRAQVRQVMRTLQKGEDAWSVNENLTHKNEILTCEWHNCVQRNEDGEITGTLSIGIDITERRRAEEQRRKLEEQIQHTQKLESLGVLAGGIAHDFNNLLVGIIGNADFALADLSPTAPVREHLEDIASAAQRAADLCRQLLAYSGKGKFVILPVDLADLVRDMTHLLEVSITHKASLRQYFASSLPTIEADPTQLRQIIMNLVTNAAEALEGRSGTVSVRVDSAYYDEAFFLNTYMQEPLPAGRYVFLEVSDNGSGMTEETRAKIFEPFYTTKFAGRGLGLAAVLGIVRGHKGAICVDSELGRGSCIRVYLPASEAQAPLRNTAPEHDLGWQGEGTVLIVDDEEGVLRTAAKMLERAGLSVFTASNGFEGVTAFEAHRDTISLVLLDMTMPEMSGEEAFRRIRELSLDVPILLTSGYNEQETLARFAGEGLAGFLQKPYTQAEFLVKVRGALETSVR